MKALNHQISAEPHRAFRLPRSKTEMSAVRAVHDQCGPRPVSDSGDGLNVRDHSVIGGRRDQNRPDIRPARQRLFHLFRRDSVSHAALQDLRIHKNRLQLPQKNRMIGRLMTVSRHQDPSALLYRRGYGSQDSRRGSIYQKKGLLRAEHLRRPPFGRKQNALRLMQIVKALDLRNIQLRCKSHRRSGFRRHVPFMAGHMKRITGRIPVTLQLPEQTAVFAAHAPDPPFLIVAYYEWLRHKNRAAGLFSAGAPFPAAPFRSSIQTGPDTSAGTVPPDEEAAHGFPAEPRPRRSPQGYDPRSGSWKDGAQ